MADRRGMVLWGAGVVVLGGALFGGYALAHRSQTDRAKRSFARFDRCLIGDARTTGESPSAAVRRIELGVEARRIAGAPAESDADWPKRCADIAEQLRAAWIEVHEAREMATTATTIDAPLRDIASTLAAGRAPTDVLGTAIALDALWATAKELEPHDGEALGVPAAPEAAKPFHLKELPVLQREGMVAESERFAGDAVRFRVLADGGALCMLDPSKDAAQSLTRGHCSPTSPTIPLGRRALTPAEAGPPRVSVFDYDRGGVFDAASGERLIAAGEPGTYGAFIAADGTASALDRPLAQKGANAFAPAFDLVTRAPGGQERRLKVDTPRASAENVDARLVADWILWIERAGDASKLHARATRGGALGPVIDLGTIASSAHLGEDTRACKTAEALFVALDDAEGNVVLLAERGGAWDVPVPAPGGRFACFGGTASFTSVDPKGAGRYEITRRAPLAVRRTVCAKGACSTSEAVLATVEVTRAETDGDKVLALDLAGKTALLWLGDALFLRVAPLDELARAPVRVLADADFKRTGGSAIQALYGYVRGGLGAVVLNTESGAQVLRLDGAGGVLPVAAR